MQTWLAAAEISAGPVFRAVARGGKVSETALVDASAARIVKLYARRVGLDAAAYSGHSLRSGFLTSAAESGASVFKMTEVSRHRSLDTLRGYVRRVDLFKEHAGIDIAVTQLFAPEFGLGTASHVPGFDGLTWGRITCPLA